jgi:hypothetical protein
VISDNNARMIITLSKELKTWLEEQAKLDNRSLSNYVCVILQKHKENLERK